MNNQSSYHFQNSEHIAPAYYQETSPDTAASTEDKNIILLVLSLSHSFGNNYCCTRVKKVDSSPSLPFSAPHTTLLPVEDITVTGLADTSELIAKVHVLQCTIWYPFHIISGVCGDLDIKLGYTSCMRIKRFKFYGTKL